VNWSSLNAFSRPYSESGTGIELRSAEVIVVQGQALRTDDIFANLAARSESSVFAGVATLSAQSKMKLSQEEVLPEIEIHRA